MNRIHSLLMRSLIHIWKCSTHYHHQHHHKYMTKLIAKCEGGGKRLVPSREQNGCLRLMQSDGTGNEKTAINLLVVFVCMCLRWHWIHSWCRSWTKNVFHIGILSMNENKGIQSGNQWWHITICYRWSPTNGSWHRLWFKQFFVYKKNSCYFPSLMPIQNWAKQIYLWLWVPNWYKFGKFYLPKSNCCENFFLGIAHDIMCEDHIRRCSRTSSHLLFIIVDVRWLCERKIGKWRIYLSCIRSSLPYCDR